MKTAISIPDDTFTQAEQRASSLGISRSEFFTRAARRYLDQLDEDAVTRQLNAVADVLNDDTSTRAAVTAGHRRLSSAEDAW